MFHPSPDRNERPPVVAFGHRQVLDAAPTPFRDPKCMRRHPALTAEILGAEARRRDLPTTGPAGERLATTVASSPSGREHAALPRGLASGAGDAAR